MKQNLIIPLGFLALAGLSGVAILRTYQTHASDASTSNIVSTYRAYVRKAGTEAFDHKPVSLPPVRFSNGVTITASFNSNTHPSATCVTLNMSPLVRHHFDYSHFKPIDKILSRYNIPFKNYGNPWKTVVFNQYPDSTGKAAVYASTCLALP
jgi:hypothetical protein